MIFSFSLIALGATIATIRYSEINFSRLVVSLAWRLAKVCNKGGYLGGQ